MSLCSQHSPQQTGIHVKAQHKNTAQSVVTGESKSCRNSHDLVAASHETPPLKKSWEAATRNCNRRPEVSQQLFRWRNCHSKGKIQPYSQMGDIKSPFHSHCNAAGKKKFLLYAAFPSMSENWDLLSSLHPHLLPFLGAAAAIHNHLSC